jgi:hypothetical protein
MEFSLLHDVDFVIRRSFFEYNMPSQVFDDLNAREDLVELGFRPSFKERKILQEVE